MDNYNILRVLLYLPYVFSGTAKALEAEVIEGFLKGEMTMPRKGKAMSGGRRTLTGESVAWSEAQTIRKTLCSQWNGLWIFSASFFNYQAVMRSSSLFLML